jgi:RecA-family ATPase
MSPLDIAIGYIQRGWAPVPIPLREKGPRIKEWQKLRITEADAPKYFSNTCNVGIILGQASGGLIDLDLDCAEAVELAPTSLPPTNAIFGRRSKPHSHWLYRVEGAAPTMKFSDPINGKMLLEIRGDGGLQTVFPGSVHPSGELIEWESDGQPATIDAAELRKRAGWLATLCLIKRYYPHQRVSDYASLLPALDAIDAGVASRIREWLDIERAEDVNPRRVPLPEYIKDGKNRIGIAARTAVLLSNALRKPIFRTEPIFEACAQMRELRDNATNQGREGWRLSLGVLAYCEGGDEIAHELSSRYANYTRDETQRELDWWRGNAHGATLCDTFDKKVPGTCGRCPRRGQVRSPISLGISPGERNTASTGLSRAPLPQIGSQAGSDNQRCETAESLTHRSQLFETVRGDELLSAPAPARHWAVADWIPGSETTMFGGDGGIGKTTLALQLSVAHITGQDWFGLKVYRCNVLYVSAEDPKDEIHFRLEQIAKHVKISKEELMGFKLINLAGSPATIAVFGRDGQIKLTPLFGKIERAAREHNAGCIILDAVADFFGGNENERREVRAFVGQLRGLAMQLRAAVVFLAHPSVDGMKTGRGYSGSTHWNNAVRSRLYFTSPSSDDGVPLDPDLRTIELAKSNRARRGEKIKMIWTDGHFVAWSSNAGQGSVAQKEADETFLKLLAKLNTQNMHVSPYPSPSYAPTILARQPGSKGIGKAALETAMHRLLDRKMIRVEEYGPPSKRRHRLVIEQISPNG